jgi:DNA polymerase elongation subunit (family B)
MTELYPSVELLYDIGEYGSWVYDLETEDGTFQAGMGSCIAKNTDSVYCEVMIPEELKSKMTDREQELMIWDYSAKCADRISDTFKKPIELELEKVMKPLYLFKKKKYMMLYKEHPDDTEHMDQKGLPTVRRDSCSYTKEVLNGVVHELLYNNSVVAAEKFARSKIEDLLNDKVGIESLTISKQLKTGYKTVNKAGNKLSKPPHAMLADRMFVRDPESAPKPGDRIPYVFIQTKKRNALQGEKSEDPEYVKQHPKTSKIDSLYYLEHQVSKPLYSMFELTVKDPTTGKLFKTGSDDPATQRKASRASDKEIRKRIWLDLETRAKNDMDGQRTITDFFTMSQVTSNNQNETDLLPPDSDEDYDSA